MEPDNTVDGCIEGCVALGFVVRTHFCGNESILKEDVQPFMERDTAVFGGHTGFSGREWDIRFVDISG